ncbi:MAG: MFS transporter [Bacteroidales bacterium]|nr:peptide MFS transporter [Bacteroidales bacterium]NPV54204.1 MFS transporter [Bacillota bacterium]
MAKQNIFRTFPGTFWVANTMELFERWAWYGFYMVLALYLTGSTDTGALGFTQEQKGNLMGPVTFLLYLLPIITGSIADRYGYKRVLLVAFLVLSSGYFLLGRVKSYWAFYFLFMYLAVGAALFKPIITATVSRTTDDRNSSIGFGIFYMIVNIGAFIGPIVASKLRIISWQWVFNMSAFIILVNFVLLLFFYKDPVKEKSGKPLVESLKLIFRNVATVLSDVRLIVFLLIIVGFWAMYLQLFYTLPVYIDQWMDTRPLYNWLYDLSPAIAAAIGTPSGTIAPEMLTNLDAFYIVLFQIAVSGFVTRFTPLRAMANGILLSSLGIGMMFAFNNPVYLIFSLLLFGLGEMATSPKTQEYVGKIAPEGKTALYMGFSYLPLAGGHIVAGFLSGSVYADIADKPTLLRKLLIDKGIQLPAPGDGLPLSDYYGAAAKALNVAPDRLTAYLWETAQPWKIWVLFTAIGLFTFIALILYNRLVIKPKFG